MFWWEGTTWSGPPQSSEVETGGLARGSARQGLTEMSEQRLEGNKYQRDRGWQGVSGL